jgi:uncharacterized protein YqiB (DUF1249 family)
MLTESDIVPGCVVRPGSFGGLMALYEGNFIKLATLLGEPGQLDGGMLSRAARDMPVYLSVIDRAKYTRVLRLTYSFAGPDGAVADPDLVVRVYLDARMVEVRSWAADHRHDVLRRLGREFACELDRRWSRNMMLSKWLDYLLDTGHVFSRCPAPLAREERVA